MYSIGIDIGGMTIKAGLVDEDGAIIEQIRVKTEKTPEKCLDKLFEQIDELISHNKITIKDIKGIGIGCPGAVSAETGVVDFLPNLGWVNVPIVKIMNERFGVPVRISNDANVAALGEAIFGAAKGYNTSVMFTLGTGVGGGIIIDKKLYEGGHGRGAELGHTTLVLDGEPCTCGRNGCIETYVSATALMRQTRAAMLADNDSVMWKIVDGDIDKIDGKTAFDGARAGDKTAKKVVDKYVMYLSESIMNMLNIFRPDAFILGGGIGKEGKYLTDMVKEYCEKFEYGYKTAPKTEILTATLGNDAGIIGAAVLFE